MSDMTPEEFAKFHQEHLDKLISKRKRAYDGVIIYSYDLNTVWFPKKVEFYTATVYDYGNTEIYLSKSKRTSKRMLAVGGPKNGELIPGGVDYMRYNCSDRHSEWPKTVYLHRSLV